MRLFTKTKEYNVAIVGISSFDNTLRIELTDTDLQNAFSVFMNPEETENIVRIWDDGGEDRYSGYTRFQSINQLNDGHIIVALSRG